MESRHSILPIGPSRNWIEQVTSKFWGRDGLKGPARLKMRIVHVLFGKSDTRPQQPLGLPTMVRLLSRQRSNQGINHGTEAGVPSANEATIRHGLGGAGEALDAQARTAYSGFHWSEETSLSVGRSRRERTGRKRSAYSGLLSFSLCSSANRCSECVWHRKPRAARGSSLETGTGLCDAHDQDGGGEDRQGARGIRKASREHAQDREFLRL